MPKSGNYAFIDTQNLNLGVRSLGWHLDQRKFRTFLKDMYGVDKAYMFIGYMPEYQELYKAFADAGFFLLFKPLTPATAEGKIKGNIDADLVLQVMMDLENYQKAIIVTNDGDFHGLVSYLYNTNKLEVLISPNRHTCSSLLLKAAQEKIIYLDDLKQRLIYKSRYRPRPNKNQVTEQNPNSTLEEALTSPDESSFS